MDKDDLWIVEHFSELVDNYPGKAIAVVNEQLVAVAENEFDAELMAKEKYPDKTPSVLTVPREEDMACLL
jgi:hypothetical protein